MTKRHVSCLAIIFITTIAVLFVFTTQSSACPKGKQTVLRGDVNRDCSFNGDDALFLLILLSEKENQRRKLHLGMIDPGDINADSKIDIKDVVEMLRRLDKKAKPVYYISSKDQSVTLAYPKQKEIVLAKGAGDKGLFVRGDANGDEKITTEDAIFILNYMLTPNAQKPKCEDVLDINDDGQITLADAIYLLEFQFTGGSKPKSPFPKPGADPTKDKLKCPTSP